MKDSIKQNLSEIISTFFYVGKIPFAPGTFGSLGAFPIYWLITQFISYYKINFNFLNLTTLEQDLATTCILSLAICLILFIVGTYCSNIYVKARGINDPQEIVIDEVVGQLLVISLCVFATTFVYFSNVATKLSPFTISFIFNFFLPFLLFRLFDIFKPWPINWFDKNVKGGFGVMLDDVIAGLFAAIMLYAITFIILDFYH